MLFRLLPIVAIAFKLWMLVDAVQRRPHHYWFWIILLVPFGDVA